MIQAGDIRTFIRDRRLYLVIRMIKRSKRMNEPGFVPEYHYALMKIPYAKVPRFIELPPHDGKYYIMFIDDIIRAIYRMFFPVILLMAVTASRFPGMRIFIWMMRAGRISWRISVKR